MGVRVAADMVDWPLVVWKVRYMDGDVSGMARVEIWVWASL